MLRYMELHGRSERGENHLEILTRCTRIPLEKAGCEDSSCDVITCFISVSFVVRRGVCATRALLYLHAKERCYIARYPTKIAGNWLFVTQLLPMMGDPKLTT